MAPICADAELAMTHRPNSSRMAGILMDLSRLKFEECRDQEMLAPTAARDDIYQNALSLDDVALRRRNMTGSRSLPVT